MCPQHLGKYYQGIITALHFYSSPASQQFSLGQLNVHVPQFGIYKMRLRVQYLAHKSMVPTKYMTKYCASWVN